MPQFGPFKRKERPGVPADHFLPIRGNRFAAVDHRGRITALIAEGLAVEPFGALPIHHTATDEGAWDGPANEARLDNDDGASVYKLAFAWVDPKADPDTKAAYRFIHHDVDANGKPGAANVKACSSTVGVLNGGRGGTTIPDADVKGVYAHVIAHLKDSGVKDADLPELKTAVIPDEPLAAADHDPFTGTHSHEHSTFGDQGGDAHHEHEHTHNGDASHGHTHSATAAEAIQAMVKAGENAHSAAQQITDAFAGVAGALSSPALDALVADPGPGIEQIVTNPGGAWHAYTHVEGIRTDDGREIAPGATLFPDLPVALRFLQKDEGGHYGAVTCGRIDTMAMTTVDGIVACLATGVFGSDKPGQEAQLAVEEQTQRFISIDPRDVEGEFIEVQVSTSNGIFDDDGDSDFDGWFRMTSFVVGAATIVPIPALQQAVITMADQPLPMAPLATERAQQNIVITASGAPLVWPDNPPAEWFTMSVPTVGDNRLVRQPDGKYAVPMTVLDNGQFFGHACYWGQEHTGFPGQKVKPPRSATYAHYMTGERVVQTGENEDGTPILDRIAVGKITMGTGHPGVHGVNAAVAKAHYDGGYGAVQVADVRAVEDDFGIWLCGALCPPWSEQNPGGPTAAQVQQFMSLDLSPDWRKVAGQLHMIAVLSVPVGGFPVARESLVASGLSAMSEQDAAGVARAAYEGDEIVAMVAAGRVHRMPLGQRVVALEHLVDELHADLTARKRESARATLAALANQ